MKQDFKSKYLKFNGDIEKLSIEDCILAIKQVASRSKDFEDQIKTLNLPNKYKLKIEENHIDYSIISDTNKRVMNNLLPLFQLLKYHILYDNKRYYSEIEYDYEDEERNLICSRLSVIDIYYVLRTIDVNYFDSSPLKQIYQYVLNEEIDSLILQMKDETIKDAVYEIVIKSWDTLRCVDDIIDASKDISMEQDRFDCFIEEIQRKLDICIDIPDKNSCLASDFIPYKYVEKIISWIFGSWFGDLPLTPCIDQVIRQIIGEYDIHQTEDGWELCKHQTSIVSDLVAKDLTNSINCISRATKNIQLYLTSNNKIKQFEILHRLFDEHTDNMYDDWEFENFFYVAAYLNYYADGVTCSSLVPFDILIDGIDIKKLDFIDENDIEAIHFIYDYFFWCNDGKEHFFPFMSENRLFRIDLNDGEDYCLVDNQEGLNMLLDDCFLEFFYQASIDYYGPWGLYLGEMLHNIIRSQYSDTDAGSTNSILFFCIEKLHKYPSVHKYTHEEIKKTLESIGSIGNAQYLCLLYFHLLVIDDDLSSFIKKLLPPKLIEPISKVEEEMHTISYYASTEEDFYMLTNDYDRFLPIIKYRYYETHQELINQEENELIRQTKLRLPIYWTIESVKNAYNKIKSIEKYKDVGYILSNLLFNLTFHKSLIQNSSLMDTDNYECHMRLSANIKITEPQFNKFLHELVEINFIEKNKEQSFGYIISGYNKPEDIDSNLPLTILGNKGHNNLAYLVKKLYPRINASNNKKGNITIKAEEKSKYVKMNEYVRFENKLCLDRNSGSSHATYAEEKIKKLIRIFFNID